jgi:hypothetical protein
VFARRPTNFCVNLILSRAGSPFTLVMQRDGWFGFERIRGQDYHKNGSTRRFDTPLKADQPYTVVVEVRKSGIKSACDGKRLSEWTEYSELTMNRDWKLPDAASLGLGTWDGGAAIRKVEIREVTGKGEFVRPGK